MATPVGAVMVVGGGISGVQAALDLADSGFKVYLVEKRPSIGGTMAQLDKTFPTNDCSMCILAPKLVAAGRHHNIELICNADVEMIDGVPGDFRVTLKKRTLRVDEKKCTGCGVCAEKCPVETYDEYNEKMKKRKAIYIMYPQAVPLVYSIDKNVCIGCGVCAEECRAKAVVYDKSDDALEISVGSIILSPGFEEFDATLKKEYGYGVYKNVVTSIEFERMLSASGPYLGTVMRPSDGEIPKKIAFVQCVGSRDEKVGRTYCSSVCCMYAIKEAIIAGEHSENLESHIFFMDIRAVGKEFEDYRERAENEYGIKIHRAARVASIEEDPVTKNLIVRYSENGNTISEEFDLVVLSVGLTPCSDAEKLSRRLNFKLNKHGFCETDTYNPLSTSRPGIFVSGSFVSPKDIPTTVAEASGAAAKAASLISSARNTLVTVKEYPPEIDVAGQEPRIGVFVCHCGINIGGVVKVPSVVEYARTLPGVVYAEDNLYTCSSDTQERIKEKIKEHRLNRVVVASCTPRTHEPLFQNTIREAGLNPYLFEMANIRDQCSWIHMHEPEKATKKSMDLVRMAVAKVRLAEPLKKFKLPVNQTAVIIGGGLAGMTAALEIAAQGFNVHLIEKTDRLGGNLAKLQLPEGGKRPQAFIDETIRKIMESRNITVHLNSEVTDVTGFVGNFKVKTKDSEIEAGAIIIATGAEEYRPTEYLYGQDSRVMTQLELEKKLADGMFTAKKIAMIQCVGSRNEEIKYCSRICCAHAIKNAIEIKKRSPATEVYVLHKDIRTYGFREELYREAAGLGVNFVRFPEKTPPVVEKDRDALVVRVMDQTLGEEIALKLDYVVLSTGIRPNPDNEKIAKMVKVPLSKDGYFLEAHMKLRPVDFATEGVFLAGLAHWPKFIDETIAQACGAAARAMTILSKKELETEGIIAAVNEYICDGCGICEPVCEYKAIQIVKDPSNPEKLRAVVNEGLCKGCGACVAACPSGAMEQKGFKTVQMIAMIDAALSGGD
ncbi:MAG: CoB--CoM heterodisulfide reductase iron-sulfur subunit A family protein [Methanomassiliicoccales archaeon]|nr:CoB--CoM heterodisulfide reductase iron-sulfur subunit A family protein [Methanomassiliicoccales archaeon]